MSFEYYIDCGREKLRCGYTTGTGAALAAEGAAQLLLTGKASAVLSVKTPKGPVVAVESVFCRLDKNGHAYCGVRKDAGDDPDITDGMIIAAEVSFRETDENSSEIVLIDGGEGIGVVTMPGLDQPVGAAAINSIPRKMIRESVLGVMKACGKITPVKVVISIPGGGDMAKKTFNPQLGIEGGLSVLGTSGIVEPMSEQALLETIRLSLSQAAALGFRKVILAPGNYGLSYIQSMGLSAAGIPVIKCSNFVGDALDMCAAFDFRQVLLAGHAGKLVKLAGGIMNTHSSRADCRRELICAHAALSGAPPEVCRSCMEAATTTECFAVLERAGLLKEVSGRLMNAIQKHLERKAAGAYLAGALVFTGEERLIGATEGALKLLKEWKVRLPDI